MKAAIYARVSTTDQTCENQLIELRRYVEARGWTAVEFVDRAVSGSTDRRPALDRLVADARRRRFDVLVVWRLDRLGRNLKHLVTLLLLLRLIQETTISSVRACPVRRSRSASGNSSGSSPMRRLAGSIWKPAGGRTAFDVRAAAVSEHSPCATGTGGSAPSVGTKRR